MDDIRMAVRQLDIMESSEEDAITVENVKASDVLNLIFLGELGMFPEHMLNAVIEGLDANDIPVPMRPNGVTDIYRVIRDEIFNG